MFFCPSIYICAMCYFGCFAKPQILNRDLSCYCAFGFFFLFWDSDYVIFVMVQSVMCDLRHFKLLINFCRWRSNIMKRYTMKFFLVLFYLISFFSSLAYASFIHAHILILNIIISFFSLWLLYIKERDGYWKMMQKYIGSDVTSMVTLPVIIFEPMTMIQKIAEVGLLLVLPLLMIP